MRGLTKRRLALKVRSQNYHSAVEVHQGTWQDDGIRSLTHYIKVLPGSFSLVTGLTFDAGWQSEVISGEIDMQNHSK